MITPRRTRLLRAPDLAAFRTTLAAIASDLTPEQARDTFFLVPTRAAAEQLRRSIEDAMLDAKRTAPVLPLLGSRADLYDELASRLAAPPRILTSFEREVVLGSVSRRLQEEGLTPPFQVRPGLVAEMLALYDLVRRLGRTIEDFERNFRLELERDRDTDRGAEQLLQQTLFLAAAFREYEARIDDAGASDEHVQRAALIEQAPARPLVRAVVTVADRIADPDGLWPADFELLTRLPALASLDVICTEPVLAAGFLERLHGVLPELEEERVASPPARVPILIVPRPVRAGADAIAFTYRDREEELHAVARRLKADRRAGRSSPLDRTALIVRRPLPYLYLARDVFGDAGVPFETRDTLPLAAEPYAAAVDLALDAVAADFTRATIVALLRSPHFDFGIDLAREAPPRHAIAALDAALAEARYLGDLVRLDALASAWSAIDAPGSRDERRQKTAAHAARAVLDGVQPLAPLAEPRPMHAQIDTLLAWLRRVDRPSAEDDVTRSRRARVRAAVHDALTALADAYRRHDPGATADVGPVSAAIRRWLGSQTFAISTGERGLQIVDAQAARYGDFDDVQLVGLVEGEWPERFRRNVLYPSSLLAQLEPLPAIPDPGLRQRDALRAARAALEDLLRAARDRVRVSTFVLEHDAVVEPSILLDDVERVGLAREQVDDPPMRVSQSDALALEPRALDHLPPITKAWAHARIDRAALDPRRFQGEAGPWTLPRVSVSRLERYNDCPFRFFASEVLRLEEQPEDEDTRTPLERGRFLHELFERFFDEWQRRGHGRVTPARLDEARTLFESICEAALAALPPAEATLERARLLGSALSPGIAHRVLAMEADRPAAVVERLLEFPLEGDFLFRTIGGEERLVPLNAKADRIDLLEDGTLRVVDYKSRVTPEIKQALQLPIYSYCARTRLEGHRNRRWTLGEALYLSFQGARPVVNLRVKGHSIDELVDQAQDRLIATLDRIAEGHFPPRPLRRSLCGPCPYSAVCRLEYVVEEAEGERG